MSRLSRLEQMVAFTLADGAGPVGFRKLCERFGDIDRILGAASTELARVDGVSKRLIAGLLEPGLSEKAARVVQKARTHAIRILTLEDEDYPKSLKEIYDPPVVLYVKGRIPQGTAVAVVGSRNPSIYGSKTAARFASDLVSAGVTVVSGMARGIDSAAHRGALDSKGKTVAVLGSGLLNLYPPENKTLAEAIACSGALVSEYAPDEPPLPSYFPVRNRIISGLSQAVLVVEAKEKSGALITADAALDQGREVFAVPGNIDSIKSGGTNRLLKQGAGLAECAADILDSLQVKTAGRTVRSGRPEGLLDDEQMVYDLLEEGPLQADDLIERSHVAASKVSQILSAMEIKGWIEQMPGKFFALKDSRAVSKN